MWIKLFQETDINTPRCDRASIFLDDWNILNIKHCDWSIVPLEKGSKDAIILRWQVSNTSVSIWDPVFMNKIINKRDLPTGTKTPLWVWAWNGMVVLRGRFAYPWLWLTPWRFYFKDNTTWKLSLTQSNFKIWYSRDSDTLLVDIDTEWNWFSSVFSAEEINPWAGQLYDFTYSPDADHIICSSYGNSWFCKFDAKTNAYLWFQASSGLNAYGIWCRTLAGWNKLYVSNSTSWTVSIFSISTGWVYTFIANVSGSWPVNRWAYSITSDKYYFGSYTGWIWKIDWTTNAISSNLWWSSYGMCWNIQMNRIYANVNNSYWNRVYCIDCDTDTIIATINSWVWPARCAYCPVNNCVYVTERMWGRVSVINCDTNTLIWYITVSWASQLYWIWYFSPNNFMYVTAIANNFVWVIDCQTNTHIKTITWPMIWANINQPKWILFQDVYEKVVLNNNWLNDVLFLSY